MLSRATFEPGVSESYSCSEREVPVTLMQDCWLVMVTITLLPNYKATILEFCR